MAAHWLLKRGAITLTTLDIAECDERDCVIFLAKQRWGSSGTQVCPSCGTIDRHYVVRTRHQWRCKHCTRTFSVTSGTPFQDHKISHKELLIAAHIFANNPKGTSPLTLRIHIKRSYKSLFALCHKLRHSLALTDSQEMLSGTIEIDGGHFSGRPRKGRKKRKSQPVIPGKHHTQHRAKMPSRGFSHHPNRRIVIAIRQMTGKPGVGAVVTKIAVVRSENTRDVEALIRRWVAPGSTVRSDEWTAYRGLRLMGYKHEVVNHQVEFSTDDGINENQAESYMSRLRRSVLGIHHRITPLYMPEYATEMGWHEDVRRAPTGLRLRSLLERCFKAGVLDNWLNYGKGRYCRIDMTFRAR